MLTNKIRRSVVTSFYFACTLGASSVAVADVYDSEILPIEECIVAERYNPMVGSWQVFITPDGSNSSFVNHASFSSDYLAVSVDTSGQSSVGSYKRIGRNHYIGQFTGPCGDCGGPEDSIVQVNISVDYSHNSREISGRFITRIITADGDEIFSVEGEARGEKLLIDRAMQP